MATGSLEGLDETELVEHRLALVRAYDDACAAYDQPGAALLHAQILTADRELRRRRGDDYFKTGLEGVSTDDLLQLFVQRAIAYDEAEGMSEVESRYWDLDKVSVELGRREGDQRCALFKLYVHPDERVHHAAAEATRRLAPALSVDRMRAVGDETWAPPADGPCAYEAQLYGLVVERGGQRPFAEQSVEELADLFLLFSIEQDEAERNDELARYNRLFSREHAVTDELKGRHGDQRRVLTRFYDHPNFKVRLNAAHATLAIMPEQARAVFEIIAQSGRQDYARSASETLRNLDSGFYKPK
jgi:hypothetical protein